MWNINNYYDMATIKDYMEFIKVLSDDGIKTQTNAD